MLFRSGQLDVLTERVDDLADGMSESGDLDDVELAAGATAELIVPLRDRLDLWLAAGVELPLRPIQIVATRGARTEVLIGTFAARPLALAGIRARLF